MALRLSRAELKDTILDMQRLVLRLPLLATSLAVLAMLVYGPIAQPPGYHEFADQREGLGLPHAADVLSNLPLSLVGLWGTLALWPARRHALLAPAWPAHVLFLVALVLIAAGSGYYHWAPHNDGLVWDRIPIALAYAGLISAVRVETQPGADIRLWTGGLALTGVLSVWWWYFTETQGRGDLRPYLLLQGLPLLLIPLWQAIHRSTRRDRMSFGVTLLLYVLARVAELYDRPLLELSGCVSGHTLKHLLAAAAAAVLVHRLIQRVREDPSMQAMTDVRP